MQNSYILVAVYDALLVTFTIVRASPDPDSNTEAEAISEPLPDSVASAEPDASAEPASYSVGYGPYAGYYGAHMGPTHYSGPMSYANYGYTSYGYGGKRYIYKRSANPSPASYSSYGGKYAGYFGATMGPTYYGAISTPHYGGYGTLGGYGGSLYRYKRSINTSPDSYSGYDGKYALNIGTIYNEARRYNHLKNDETLNTYERKSRLYKRMSDTDADSGYEAYGYGYPSYGLAYGYR